MKKILTLLKLLSSILTAIDKSDKAKVNAIISIMPILVDALIEGVNINIGRTKEIINKDKAQGGSQKQTAREVEQAPDGAHHEGNKGGNRNGN